MTWGFKWHHALEAHAEDFGDLKKVSELSLAVRRRRATFEAWWWVPNMLGEAHGKARIERLCISLPYIETFNSKVIKDFVPELRSRHVFFVFRNSYVLCINVMNILCTFHISVPGYGTLPQPTGPKTLVGDGLTLFRDAVGVSCYPNQLGHKTLGGGPYPLQRFSRCILQHQPIGLQDTCWGSLILCGDAIYVFCSPSRND